MDNAKVSEDAIFECFAAAEKFSKQADTAESFVDVEEYENGVMYPSFARWANQAGYPEIAKLFSKVAGEEKLHAQWLREIYSDMEAPQAGQDTVRAKDALKAINANLERLVSANPEGLIEKALKVAFRVEMRECKEIYPAFRDQALAEGNARAAAVYQRVIASETEHAHWFEAALKDFQSKRTLAL